MPCHNYDHHFSRRDFLRTAGCGFGALALSALTGEQTGACRACGNWGRQNSAFPCPGQEHHFLFMEGGPSHLDLFDPKPLLNKLAGQTLPDSFEKPVTAMGEASSPLLESRRQWAQHGESAYGFPTGYPIIARLPTTSA